MFTFLFVKQQYLINLMPMITILNNYTGFFSIHCCRCSEANGNSAWVGRGSRRPSWGGVSPSILKFKSLSPTTGIDLHTYNSKQRRQYSKTDWKLQPFQAKNCAINCQNNKYYKKIM